MKEPRLRHLTIDQTGTKTIRTALKKSGQVTITVHLHPDDLRAGKTRSKKADLSYQHLFYTLLTTTAQQQTALQLRLKQVEQELRKIKRHAAA